jgi:hypothetical protein
MVASVAADARMCVTYRVCDVCHHRLAAPTTAWWSTVKIVGSTGVDPGDIAVVARSLTADEALDDAALELALREMLDPAGQRTARPASACPESGRLPARTSSSSAGILAPAAATRRRTVEPTTVDADTPSTSRPSTRSGAATRRSGSAGSARTLRPVRHRWALRALTRSDDVKDSPVDLRPPQNTMTARPAPQLPDEHHSGSLTFEPKLDGWLN